ncbi:hypothetical protein [Streptomyces sp. NBC_01314]|uniref:hypothetical protein n=1 Tax=Streptomyces sp. NBC_01314 TaxID=2903821 RepID=UPI00308E4B7C|nr:hypothetical protein OG622_23725 [Streptomyces sp. NBC_01314]
MSTALTSSDADAENALLAMLSEPARTWWTGVCRCGFGTRPSGWCSLVLLRRPDEPALMRVATFVHNIGRVSARKVGA